MTLVRESPPSCATPTRGSRSLDARAARPASPSRGRCSTRLHGVADRRSTTASPLRLARGDEASAGVRVTAGRFFSRAAVHCCSGSARSPDLVAPRDRAHRHLRREIEGITQCVLESGRAAADRKAEGAAARRRGSVFRYGARGRACRCWRQRGLQPGSGGAPEPSDRGHLSQADARPSRGRLGERHLAGRAGPAGPLLETLLDLAGKLNISLDELLRGDVAPGYRLARRDDPRTPIS